jgi:hypothetical protein
MLLIIRQNWFLASRIALVVHLKMISGNEFPSVFVPVFTASRRDKSTRFHCGIRIVVVASSLWLAPFGAQRRYYRFPTPSARHICRTINQTKNLVPAGRHIPMMSLLNGALEFLRCVSTKMPALRAFSLVSFARQNSKRHLPVVHPKMISEI